MPLSEMEWIAGLVVLYLGAKAWHHEDRFTGFVMGLGTASLFVKSILHNMAGQ